MNFKIPKMLKVLFGLLALFLISYNVFYKAYKENKNKKMFYDMGFFSKICSSNSYEGRSVEFHLENGLKLYFLPPVENKLMIGDSIKKKSNTYNYDVYRKDVEGIYKFWSTYNFEKIQ